MIYVLIVFAIVLVKLFHMFFLETFCQNIGNFKEKFSVKSDNIFQQIFHLSVCLCLSIYLCIYLSLSLIFLEFLYFVFHFKTSSKLRIIHEDSICIYSRFKLGYVLKIQTLKVNLCHVSSPTGLKRLPLNKKLNLNLYYFCLNSSKELWRFLKCEKSIIIEIIHWKIHRISGKLRKGKEKRVYS